MCVKLHARECEHFIHPQLKCHSLTSEQWNVANIPQSRSSFSSTVVIVLEEGEDCGHNALHLQHVIRLQTTGFTPALVRTNQEQLL